MTSFASLLGGLMVVLESHPICQQVTVVETKTFSLDQFFFKLRARLPQGYKFQVRIYYNRGHIDYAYQLFTDVPILRWDNKEEFRHLDTYPHHHHDDRGNVKASPLAGDPLSDIEAVLGEISVFLSVRSQEKK